ncbi:MAG: tRNA (N(6)-L-threonylcarbamoyladenosine(37)-C(2))-methylthiotransferase [Nanoarchaeota archaeon]|nr:tRNA (N(6)-L-threonylcarbamoyladenosine(37)-C(2))-methylthiotransferase [Nanoarchaeota archaeon]
MSKVHVITQGCTANQADSEIMQGLLLEQGHSLVGEDEAEAIVYNSCSVKGPTITAFKKKLKLLRERGKKVIVAGCIPQSNRAMKELSGHSLLGTDQVDKIGEMVTDTLDGQVLVNVEKSDLIRINLPKVRTVSFIEAVPILQGCLSSCTFCKTKHARGNAFSYPAHDIVRKISNSVRDGVKEIWLTSQDNSVYGLENDTNLAELLDAIDSIDRDFKVRVGMANPKHMLPYLPALISAFQRDSVYKFLHLPLQAGSDGVLEDMKRGYTVDEFMSIVTAFRKAIPMISISTDIICGFPTETDADFEKTLAVVEEMRPDTINISRFWPMEGTPARRMKQIEGGVIKDRTRRMTELFHSVALARNKEWIGWSGAVFIDEEGTHGSWKGRNYAYKQVVVQSSENLLGKSIMVKVVDASSLDAKAEIVAR